MVSYQNQHVFVAHLHFKILKWKCDRKTEKDMKMGLYLLLVLSLLGRRETDKQVYIHRKTYISIWYKSGREGMRIRVKFCSQDKWRNQGGNKLWMLKILFKEKKLWNGKIILKLLQLRNRNIIFPFNCRQILSFFPKDQGRHCEHPPKMQPPSSHTGVTKQKPLKWKISYRFISWLEVAQK